MTDKLLEPVESGAQADAPRHQAADHATKVWLTVRHATEYLDFPSVNAFRLWARRHGVASARCGKSLRFARRDLDAAVKAGR